ncbi:MAG TPA: hypothetical protein PKM57_05175 [Kiritimatiellia bacterium]|nr:hypothetical protein [Kiritimatiellia bacterium]HPS09600.1 hypothetical protein [Kiritimatiellia bacterium]
MGVVLSAQMLLIGGLSQQAGAAPLGVGYREAFDLTVADAATSNLTDRLWVSEGTLNKTGAGTLVLATSNLTVQSGGAVFVRDGSLRVSGSTNAVAALAPCPTEVMSLAAFWVDASTNLVTASSNGNTYVDAWLDAREPDTEAPYIYPRAVANLSLTNCAPQVILNAGIGGTLPSVWFGRYKSLRTMTWTTPANAVADITKICHVFAVHGVFQSYGYIFGTMGGEPDFHINEYSGGSPTSTLWHPGEWTTTAVRQGRTYLDGERVDGTVTSPKAGWQLLEVAMATKLPHAANFFNDRSISSTANGFRQGGDNLCEVAVFTNRLSETDRLRVQSYLMQKWLAPKPAPAFAASAAATGTLIADVAAGEAFTARLNGDGALQKQGGGTLVLEDVAAVKTLLRSASLLEGVLDARVPIPLALAAGDRVTAANTALALAQDAGADRIVKTGAGSVTVTAIPADLGRLEVQQGTLILTPPALSNTVAAQASGAVSNATFEAELLTSYRRNIANGETYNGWTASFPAPTGSADNAVFIFNHTVAGTNVNLNWACPYDAPEGQQVLALKQDASVSTTLSLPAAGIYDLSFYTSARSILSNRHEFDLCLVDGAVTTRVATVQTVNQPYVRQTFRLPWLEAGDHTLLFRRTVMGVDTLGTIDDVKVTLVSETTPSLLSIPNGDFELTEYPRNPTAFTTSNLASGWAFTATTNNLATAGITMPASSTYFYNPSTAYGSVMLGIFSNGVASTTLTLPAGTYKLQGDICGWPCSLNGYQLGSPHQVTATVSRASSENVVLGMVTTYASILTTTAWPTAFTVTNNETVTLSLAGKPQRVAMLIDNLALVPQTSPIVLNGGFEASANWTFAYNTNVQPKDNATYNSLSSSNDYGTAIFDGTRRLLLVQTGIAYQDIQLPAAGLYRLVFHAAQRCPLTYGNSYGHNPVRAWLAQNGTTNVLGWTRVDDTPLVRREFLFTVAAAGTYRFGLQGMTDNSAAFPGTDQNALLDGVSIEPVNNLGDASFALPKELSLSVAAGARLQLSFSGTQTVDEVRYDGHLVTGVMSQQTCPEFVSGPGALFANRKGTAMLIR